MIREALLIRRDEIGRLPLHRQTVVWAARDNVKLVRLGDDVSRCAWCGSSDGGAARPYTAFSGATRTTSLPKF
jgi:hypothetical protein